MPRELIDSQRATESSFSEDLFVELFQEALGFERTQLLIPEYPVSDIYGTGRFIDFTFISRLDKYAFEIDGEAWHAPGGAMVDQKTYRDELLRQNSLVYQGWKVYRWTDVQLAVDRERIKEQLLLFLEREITEGTLDGFLPRQEGSEVSLREHQTDALQQLDELRNQGKTIALLTHATGTGKTHTALSDARSLGLRTLYLAHRTPLLSQTQARFAEIWSDASSTIYRKRQGKPDTQIVLSTVQAMAASLTNFDEREFGYIIVDEAHRETIMGKAVLAYGKWLRVVRQTGLGENCTKEPTIAIRGIRSTHQARWCGCGDLPDRRQKLKQIGCIPLLGENWAWCAVGLFLQQ